MPFLKHRNELEIFAFDFAARLVVGETLSTPQVTVALRSNGTPPYTDKTSEFVTGSPTVAGAKVQFTLKAAAAAEQAESVFYLAYGKATTSLGRILVATTNLSVTDEARTS